MPDTNVLVTFFSRCGATERLALQAALGAVQARAKIRLRWLREDVEDGALEGIEGWRENRERMLREYIAPREIDIAWADAMVLALPERDGACAALRGEHVRWLRGLSASGHLKGKIGTAFAPGERGLVSLCDVLEELGLTLIAPGGGGDALDAARLHGQEVAKAARGLK